MDVVAIENGQIYFLYRPRVVRDRLYCILSPQGQRYRLLLIGRRKLPEPAASGRQRFWSIVSMVRDQPESFVDELGTHHCAAARPAGEGVYQIVRHGDQTHLIYALELPEPIGAIQRDLGIAKQAGYILSVKNPMTAQTAQTAQPNLGLPQHAAAKFPRYLQEKFADRRFISVDTPRFLDYEGAEIGLIAAGDAVSASPSAR